MSTKCYHRYPLEDENPVFYECLGSDSFDGVCKYKCIHCNKIYYADSFTTEGLNFEKKFLEIQKQLSREK